MSDQSQRGRVLLDAEQIDRVVRRMAGEIVEQNHGVEGLLLVGVRTRGLPLAEEIREAVADMEGTELPLGVLDITLYRDDLSTIAPQPVVKSTKFPEPIDGKTVVLCDDVLFTGRTVRAALDALVDFGRPDAVRLAVLVDRGLRELPVQADVVGRRVTTTHDQQVDVAFPDTDDGRREVVIRELKE